MSKSLVDKILQASNVIHKSNLRGGSNWLITSSPVSNSITKYLSDIKRNWRKDSIKKIFNL